MKKIPDIIYEDRVIAENSNFCSNSSSHSSGVKNNNHKLNDKVRGCCYKEEWFYGKIVDFDFKCKHGFYFQIEIEDGSLMWVNRIIDVSDEEYAKKSFH